jgi:hypothetical protein
MAQRPLPQVPQPHAAVSRAYDTLQKRAEERGHAKRTVGAGVGGLIGAMAGSFRGGLAAAVGAGLGALVGAVVGEALDRGDQARRSEPSPEQLASTSSAGAPLARMEGRAAEVVPFVPAASATGARRR